MKTISDQLLLSLVRNHFSRHPEECDQLEWAARDRRGCGTTYCVAGLAVVLAGYRLEWWSRVDKMVATTCTDEHGEVFYILIKAQELLGLSDYEVSSLFYCADEEVLPKLDRLIAEREARAT